MSGKVIDDTVQGRIIETDLYSLIYPVKERHFVDYGRTWDHNYEEKMLALADGKPQQRLHNDRIAREVVRAILTATDRYGCGSSWVRMEGMGRGIRTYGATTFPEVSDDNLRQRLYALMKEDGLLDVMFGACGDPGSWCFESEIIYWEEKVTPSGAKQKPYTNSMARFEANQQLREAVIAMLKPFEAEKPMYIHPERR